MSPTLSALCDAFAAGDRFDPLPSPARRGDQPGAAEDHRDGQPLAHVQPGRLSELDEMLIGLPPELDDEPADSVAEQESADEPPGIIACVGPPEQEPEDQEE